MIIIACISGIGCENADIVIVIADQTFESFSIAEKVVKLCSEMDIERVSNVRKVRFHRKLKER